MLSILKNSSKGLPAFTISTTGIMKQKQIFPSVSFCFLLKILNCNNWIGNVPSGGGGIL